MDLALKSKYFYYFFYETFIRTKKFQLNKENRKLCPTSTGGVSLSGKYFGEDFGPRME